MTFYFFTFVLAMAAALAATPVARRAAIRLDIVDRPSARKVHLDPMPYLGGVAIYVAFTVILVVGLPRGPLIDSAGSAGTTKAVEQLLAILGGASLMAVLGLVDDRFGLAPLIKLSGQFLGAIILVAFQITVHFNHAIFRPLEVPITVLWIVGITNAFNLMDNMDGLAVGTAGIAACFFFLHAVLALPMQTFVAPLAAALAGACFGFLYYNWSPAKIFMGDAGSLFLGYLLGALALKLSLGSSAADLQRVAHAIGYSVGGVHAVALLAPVFILGLPIFDTSMVTISRLRRGVPISQGGKDHTSHRLVQGGMSHREAVMTLYLASCGLGAISLVLIRSDFLEGAVLSGVTLCLAALLFMRFERIYHTYQAQQQARAVAGPPAN